MTAFGVTVSWLLQVQGPPQLFGKLLQSDRLCSGCRASLEGLKVMNSGTDIIHLHEWQTSAAAMLYWDVYYNKGFSHPRLVLTIHNMDNSGECRQDEFAITGVPGVPRPLKMGHFLCSGTWKSRL